MVSSYEIKKCKGAKKCNKNDIKFDNFKNCLFSEEDKFRKIYFSYFSIEINKIALSSQDHKRIICKDKVNTLAIGYKGITLKNY